VGGPWRRAARKPWLDPEIEDATALQQLLWPFSCGGDDGVSGETIVNKAGNEGPECVEAVTLEA
jgi:hypothetical protein